MWHIAMPGAGAVHPISGGQGLALLEFLQPLHLVERQPAVLVAPGVVVRHGARTVYGWPPRGKGFAMLWVPVGRGHVYGVVVQLFSSLRALMKSAGGRVQINGARS
jgi:hypothetical protein